MIFWAISGFIPELYGMYLSSEIFCIRYIREMNIESNKELIQENRISDIILIIRGKKVILDSDLAALYGVETKRLNEQVRRNSDRFPEDFMFQLTKEK
jgi:hypothetical protein